MKWVSCSPEETLYIGKNVAQHLPKERVIILEGPLGTGKTTLVKGIVAYLTSTPPNDITSPTFTYLHSYGDVHHFDLYRLKSTRDFLSKGFDEYLDMMCLIEWPDRIASLLHNPITITITGSGDEPRTIEVLR